VGHEMARDCRFNSKKMDPTAFSSVDPSKCYQVVERTRPLGVNSVQFEQVGQDLVHISFPFWNVCNGQNGIHTVVSARIDRFHEKAVDFEDAENVAILDDALGQAYAVVPHVARFLV
jgi:hypothetical protein